MLSIRIAMKKYLISVLVLFTLSACNQSNLQLTYDERDSLVSLMNQHDSSLNDFIIAYHKIEQNLDSVSVNQIIINMKSTYERDSIRPSEAGIRTEVSAINMLMHESRRLIAELSEKFNNTNSQSIELNSLITLLKKQVIKKDNELVQLNLKIAALNLKAALLKTSVDNLFQTIELQNTTLHKAYYVIGSTKELESANIIDRSGGLLGIGRTTTLNGNLDESKFIRVDYTQMGAIPVDSKSIKIITPHPENSFSLDRDKYNIIRSIEITDPEKFWSASKYLVVIKE